MCQPPLLFCQAKRFRKVSVVSEVGGCVVVCVFTISDGLAYCYFKTMFVTWHELLVDKNILFPITYNRL